jgi:hypothetical protein
MEKEIFVCSVSMLAKVCPQVFYNENFSMFFEATAANCSSHLYL